MNHLLSILLAAWSVHGLTSAQSTIRVSVDSLGGQANAASTSPAYSANGRFVAFESLATNFVPGDSNLVRDVFVRDLLSGSTTRVSVGPNGEQGNAGSQRPSLSSDGRYVAFESAATNWITGATFGSVNLFVHDRVANSTIRVGSQSVGTAANAGGYRPSVSDDGRYVAFAGLASNLVAGDTNGVFDVFVHDCQAGTTTRVSEGSSGTEANGLSLRPVISPDGRFVLFDSAASNLVAGDTNAAIDAFLHDRLTGVTERVSVGDGGAQANFDSFGRSMSPDARWIAFASQANNLATLDSNDDSDVFLRDRPSDSTRCISLTLSGETGERGSYEPTVSADGRWVAFRTRSAQLTPNDTNGADDIVVADVWTGTLTRVSDAPNGVSGLGVSTTPVISGDGHWVVFESAATNLVVGDTNGAIDVFVHDRALKCYADSDQDGFGDPDVVILSYPPTCPLGYVDNDQDCDDSAPQVHPGAVERCNGIDDDCNGLLDDGFLEFYCTSGVTVAGCTPRMGAIGAPSATSTSGFRIQVEQAPTGRVGLIFVGLQPSGSPWTVGSSSYQCVAGPFGRTGPQATGSGAGACDGSLDVDWNSWRAAHPSGVGSPYHAGQMLFAQGWFRDPGAVGNTNLSNAVRFTLCD